MYDLVGALSSNRRRIDVQFLRCIFDQSALYGTNYAYIVRESCTVQVDGQITMNPLHCPTQSPLPSSTPVPSPSQARSPSQSRSQSPSLSQSPAQSRIAPLGQNSGVLATGSIAAIVTVVIVLIIGSTIFVILFLRRCQSAESHESLESSDGHDEIKFVEDLAGKEKTFVLSPSLKDIFYQEEHADFTKIGRDADPFTTIELK
jgi:hypothetical protein